VDKMTTIKFGKFTTTGLSTSFHLLITNNNPCLLPV